MKKRTGYGMSMSPGVKTSRPGAKHTVTRTKKLRGEPKMAGPGLSKAMMSKRGVGSKHDAAGKAQMRKHGMCL